MNKDIIAILEKLENQGFAAYVVGGYVRDYLLKRPTNDVDICTSAPGAALTKIFGFLPNNFGGIHFKVGDFEITITTYRWDQNYVNGFPQQINFNVDLKTDLARRDFTINALAMDKKGQIISYDRGLDDIKNKVIRMIGDPQQRIEEDPLRILRAIRLALSLDFTIEETLAQVLKENMTLIANLSTPRRDKEIAKIKACLKGPKETTLCQAWGLDITKY